MLELPFHRFDRAHPPALLVGGISLVRSLGLAGIPAIVASSDPEEPAFASKHCVARVLLPRRDRPDEVAEALARLGEQLSGFLGRRVPLIYGSDEALELIHGRRARLQRYFLLLLNDPAVGAALIDKDRFREFARERGLPVPRSLAWEGRGPDSLAAASGPVVVKPSRKDDWHHSALCQRLFGGDGKALVFPSGAAALADPVVAASRRLLTFQEYIPGGDRDHWSYHGFADESGEVLASFVGRKLRTFPAHLGESAFIEMARDDALEAVGREVARRCPLRGAFKMDFKRDPRDGRWLLLEVNARYNLWHYLGAVNGVNLPGVAYDYLVHGRRPGTLAPRARYRWLSLALDFRAYREMAARGELGLARWLLSILASRNVYNVFAWSDPRPWRVLWSRRLARAWERGSRRALGLLPWRSTAS